MHAERTPFTLDVVSHLIGSSSESFHNHLHTIHGAPFSTRFSPSTSTCSSLSFPSTSFTPSCTLSSSTRSSWKALCYSANEESEDAYDVSTSLTGYEPNFVTFGELTDSSVPFSFMIPSSDQDMDDVTLGKLLTEGTPRTSRRRLLCSMDQGNLMELEKCRSIS